MEGKVGPNDIGTGTLSKAQQDEVEQATGCKAWCLEISPYPDPAPTRKYCIFANIKLWKHHIKQGAGGQNASLGGMMQLLASPG